MTNASHLFVQMLCAGRNEQLFCDRAKRESDTKLLSVGAMWQESYHDKHTIVSVSDLHILRERSYYVC